MLRVFLLTLKYENASTRDAIRNADPIFTVQTHQTTVIESSEWWLVLAHIYIHTYIHTRIYPIL